LRTFFALLLLVALAIGGCLAWALRMPLHRKDWTVGAAMRNFADALGFGGRMTS